MESWEVENTKPQSAKKINMKLVWRFMKLLEVKVHYYKIEVYHMSSWFRRIMNQFSRFMELVEHSSNIGWRVHELA